MWRPPKPRVGLGRTRECEQDGGRRDADGGIGNSGGGLPTTPCRAKNTITAVAQPTGRIFSGKCGAGAAVGKDGPSPPPPSLATHARHAHGREKVAATNSPAGGDVLDQRALREVLAKCGLLALANVHAEAALAHRVLPEAHAEPALHRSSSR